MSYEPPILSRKLGYGDAKAPESVTKSHSRLSQGEKPVNGLSRSLHQQSGQVQRQDFKLLIDPALKKGHVKIYRYNGVFEGQPPVVPKDPRSRRTRIWSLNKADLPVPNFKVDKWYVGIPPQREVHFSGLNDNVDKKFLEEMCERYGRIDAIKIYFDPQTKKHTGKGRVTYATTAAAKLAVSKLDHTSVMGNIIKAYIETNAKVHEVHGKNRGLESSTTRRNSGHEMPPSVLPSSQLPTPTPSIMSQSSSTDSSVLSPSLLLMKSPASSVCLPADIWGTSLSGPWDKSAVSIVNKLSQNGPACMSPQSVSSGQSTFEPVSPPHSFLKNNEPPPPPPPTSKPPLPPANKEPPPPLPKDIPAPSSSCFKYEDISPDPVFSPGEEDKLGFAKKGKEELNTRITKTIDSRSRSSVHSSSPPRKARSPRIDRSESYSKWAGKKQVEREEKYRDKYRESDRGCERDRSFKDNQRLERHGDYRHKRDGYFDRRDDYRQSDYDRNRSGRWEKDDTKYRRDRYSTSPRRSDEYRRSDVKDLRNRDPRLRDKDSESSRGRELHGDNERDKEERGEDGYTRDPRLKGRNLDLSETHKHGNKIKEKEVKRGSLETKDSVNKSQRDLENISDNSESFVEKDFSKLQDPRLREKDDEPKGIYYSHQTSSLKSKNTVEQQEENHEAKDNDQECVSESVETESTSKPVSAEEIISSVVAGTPLSETTGGSGYSEDAYILGVETCSDEEEPLPPGDERDVAHEVQLDIARNKIKAAQNAVKKRKLSETAFQDEKKNGGSKSKKIQIVLKSVQLNSVENEQTASSNVDDSTKDAESTGGWSSVSPDVAADVSVSSEAEDSSSRLNLPLTEDISPCNSPTIETTTHTECETSATSQDPAPIELYSDIEANEDENCVGDVNNDDNDDAMSLSSISSNEDTLEVTELDSKPSESSKGISVPPPNVVFPPYPPPIFNPNIPPPPFFNPRVPPPPITVPPPRLPTHPVVPPPTICPTLSARPIIPPSVPPPGGPPMPIPPPSIPPSFSGASGFYNPRAVPQFSSSGYANSGSYGYQKQEQKKHWSSVIIDEVYRNICGDLETVVKRDIFKKLVQASAFKALESWWDNQSKPKTTPMSTTSSARSVSMGTNPSSTIGLASNSGTDPSAIGPSPFDRSHSMLLGLRASLPKLPSFKVKRPPQPPKTEQQSFSSRKRSNTESSDLERDSKKQMVEGADLGMETDLESSSASNKAPRAVSRMEGERSHSPWQQLDESMDAAPRATIVRSTEGEERRPSTGSSLYHKVYSSSSSESGSDASDSEEEEEEEEGESEEGSEEESESSESEDESDSESEEEDVPSESKEDGELAKTEMEIKEDIERNQEITPMVMESEQDSVQKSFTPVSVQDLPSSKWNESVVSSNKELERTVETKTVSQTTNCKVEQVAHMEPFHSFHIANIVPDLFKNHDDSSDRAELTEDESDSTQNEPKIVDKSDETRTGMDLQGLNQYGGHGEGNHSSSVVKVEEPLEKKDVKSPLRPPEFGSQDKENIQPFSLKFIPEEKSVEQMDQDDDVLEDRRPLLSPNKPLAVSLVELDHSYGLTIPEPMLAQEEETKSFDEPLHPGNRDLTESPLPGQRKMTESPVVDIVTVDSVQPRRPVPDLSLLKPQFPVRSFEVDDELAYEFLRLGIDAEDCHYMKVGFEQLQQVGSQSVLDAHWSSHPTAQTAPKSRRKQKTEQGVRVHLTGCARSEGFYKIDIKEKAKYLQGQRRQLQCQANITEKEQKTDGNKAKQQSREHRAIQRRLQSAVCNEEFGDLLKFNQLRVRKKQLRFAKSGIHDWGLFAQESIAADEMVTEYVGEIIRQPIADIRERRYEEMGIGSSYLFRVDQDTIIDATTKGNLARFINHCCDPNCYAKIVTLENEKKIVIYSKRDIQVNEEITYDYKFPIEDEKIPCLCGAPQCRGTLN